MTRRSVPLCIAAVLIAGPAFAQPQDRATKVRKDKEHVEALGLWIYNDLPRGFEEARKSGKPLLVVFRCIPCEACAQIDEQVVERDPAVRALMDKFICVRIVHANGLDMSLFQCDYDQSWAAFLMNADQSIYGRYGTRSHRTKSEDDVSLEGFGKALEAALTLHALYPANKAILAGKRGPAAEVKAPEEFPSLKGRYKTQLDYGGQVVQSCIHCHQIGEAQRLVYRSAGKPIPEMVLYPHPNPKVVGLTFDPKEKTTVKSVAPGSSAEKDGFRPGDDIVTLDEQPLLSIADVQWLLHNASETGSFKAEVRRNGQKVPLTLTLNSGWRQRDDLSWRSSSWDLRRMVMGGLVLEELPAAGRKTAGLADSALALRIKYVGQFGAHAVAKNAGFKTGDIVITVKGQSEHKSESDLLATLVQQTRPGDRIPITVLRDGKKIELTLPMQ